MSDSLTPSQKAAIDEFAIQLGTKPVKKKPSIDGIYSALLWIVISATMLTLTVGLVLSVWGVITWALFGKVALTIAVGVPVLVMAIALMATAGDRRR